MKINEWNVFERFTTRKLLSIGIVGALVGSSLAVFFKGRFDGVLDLHFVNEIEWYQPFVDNFLAILILSICLFFTAKLLNSKTRFIDILNAVLIGRLLIYTLLFSNINSFISALSEKAIADPMNIQIDGDTILLIVFGLFSLALLFVFFCVVYVGFRVATNYKKWRGLFYFCLTVIVAELLSLFLFTYFL